MRDETGAVTAELAVLLPAVFVVLAICVGAMSLQLNRIALVESAANTARALGRDEPRDQVLSQSVTAGEIAQVTTEGADREFVCVQLTKNIGILGLSGKLFELRERSCARRGGL